METMTASSAAIDSEELAQAFITQAATDAQTTGEYLQDIDNVSSTLGQANGPMKDVADLMKKNASEIREVLDGSMTIKIDQNMEAGVNGYTYIGGTDSTTALSPELFYAYDTTQELAQTIDHERRHHEQVELQTGGQETIFVTADGENIKDTTLFYEGDTEMHTTKTFGRRNDQPQEYADGHDMGIDITQEHEAEWHETLTVTGDLASLQGEVWEAGLKDGSLAIDELIVQADQTGYTEAAAQALQSHIQTVGVGQ